MFKKTLYTLTLQYSALLLLVFTAFSGAIYEYMEYTFGSDYPEISLNVFKDDDRKPLQASDVADAGLDRLREALLGSYIILMILVPLISYLLARRSLKPLQKSFEDQQRFVDDASHELRTPLSVLQGELELALLKQRNGNEYRSAISTSLEEVHRLSDLISQLLLLARGSRVQLQKSFVQVELDSLLKKIAHKYRKLYPNIKIRVEHESEEYIVGGISTLIEQAFSNIIDNAAKFGRINTQINVLIQNVDGQIIVDISDNGPGMDNAQSRKAFERFWRADSSRSIKGFGLGLSLVKQIIELHSGTVRLESKVSAGSTVKVTLPVLSR